MSYKIYFGILNYDRPIENVQRIVEQLPGEMGKNIFVATNNKKLLEDEGPLNGYVKLDSTVASAKNKFLRKARSHAYPYCFIIEDDVILKDPEIFTKYIDLMNRFKLNLTMYGYHGGSNRALGNSRPNPSVRMRIDEDEYLLANRYVCSAVMGFRITGKMKMFDDQLKAMETEYLLKDLTDADQYPNNGFYIDLDESWTYFSKTDDDRVRVRTGEMANADVEKRQERIVLDSNLDEFLGYVLSKLENERHESQKCDIQPALSLVPDDNTLMTSQPFIDLTGVDKK